MILSNQPYCSGEIWVDRYGDPVEGRAPDESDFIAFAPLPLTFQGTLPHYAYDGELTAAENRQAFTQRLVAEAANRAMLQKAMFLVAQSGEGRRLMKSAQELNFSIMFDRRKLEERQALGWMDYRNKLIPLHPETTPARLARTLRHELEHMEQIHNGLDYHAGMSLRSILVAGRAMEAGARVAEAQMAVHLALPMPGDHPRQYKTREVVHDFCDQYRSMGKALRETAHLAQAGRWTVFAAELFQSFYQEKTTLIAYDRNYLRYLNKSAPAQADLNFMAGDFWSHATLAVKMKIYGQPYLPPPSDAFNLDQPPFSSFVSFADIKRPFVKLLKKLHRLDDKQGATRRVDALYDALRVKPDKGLWQLAAARFGQWTKSLARKEMASLSFPTPEKPREDFAIFRLPSVDRLQTDNAHGCVGDAARYAPCFAESLLKAGNYADPADRFRVALETTANPVPSVNALARAGLRGPIAAFPEIYLNGLLRKLDAIGPDRTDMPRFEPEDMLLFQHWIALAKNGIDPVTGHPPGKGELVHDITQARRVGNSIPAAASVTFGVPASIEETSLARWGRDILSALAPEAERRARTPKTVAAALRQ